MEMIQSMFELGLDPVAPPESKEPRPLDGKIFVFTGSLDKMTRDAAKRLVKSLGGRVGSSVGKKTDYVVSGKDPGSKRANAAELGVKILSEEEFLYMVTSED